MSDIEREEFNQWILDSEYALASPATRRWLFDAFQAGRASGQDAEPVAEVGDNHVLQWCPPYSRPPIGTKLFAGHPPAANQGVPEGWKLVPIKPTKEMREVCRIAGKTKVWDDMIAAAPTPPQPMEDE